MPPACRMRRSPPCRLVSLNVPEASTATYASSPLPTAVIAGKAAQTSREMPAKISFLRPVASMARATRASSNALSGTSSKTVGVSASLQLLRSFLVDQVCLGLNSGSFWEKIVGALAGLAGAFGGGGGLTPSVTSSISYGGAEAGGGPVSAGTAYLVNESGNSEFFIPSTSGRIVPSG